MENNLIGQVKSELTDYSKSLTEAGKLRLVGFVSRILGLFLLLLTVILCVLALFMFGAVAAIVALSAYMPLWAAALVIAGVFGVLLILAIVFRKPLFVHPFIKRMTARAKNERDLEWQIMEAEHNAEVQRVRMEGHVESATREIDFYVGLLRRLWNYVIGKKETPEQEQD